MNFVLDNKYWIVGLIVILLFVVVMIIFRKKTTKPTKILVDENYLEQVTKALGGFDNIKRTEIEHKRVRIFLINVKLIESETFKTLNIPVFLKGNEAKLLLKEKPELVKQYLDKKGA